MNVTISRTYEVDAAHHLTSGIFVGHKCRRPHGHRYVVTVSVAGTPDAYGLVLEYGALDVIVWSVLIALDHHDANTLGERDPSAAALAVAENPTAERIALWVFESVATKLASSDQRVARVRVEESGRSSAEVS